jgi:hypothetical protein
MDRENYQRDNGNSLPAWYNPLSFPISIPVG